jgi:hypothetical protein
MNLLNLLLLALAYLVGVVIVKQALSRAEYSSGTNDDSHGNIRAERHSHRARTKVVIGRLSRT